jgi:proline dehydrogenase
VDMESSEYTARTIEIVERAFRDGGDTGTVLQSYLRRTGGDLGRLVALGSRIRLVKGAYLEPESVAYTDKSKVDEKFLEQSKALLCEGRYPAIATHDERIIEALREFVAEREIDKSTFEWQMLYGIRRDLQQKLLDLGYNVRVYIPFGAHWYPYFTRRLAERPANLAFILRSLFRS